MTCISHNGVYKNGIHELDLDEIFQVSGGTPAVPAAITIAGVGIAAGTLIGASFVVAGIAANAVAGLLDGLAGNPPAVK